MKTFWRIYLLLGNCNRDKRILKKNHQPHKSPLKPLYLKISGSILLGSPAVESHKEKGRRIIPCTWKWQEKESELLRKWVIVKLLSFGKKTLLERITWQVRVWSHHSGHLPRKNPIQLIRLQATPWKSGLSQVILIFLLATCCWDCHQPLRWTTSNLVYFTWSSHGSFLTVTLLRQCPYWHSVSWKKLQHRSSRVLIALVCWEAWSGIRNACYEPDCVEIGIYCLICSVIKKYMEDNFLFT